MSGPISHASTKEIQVTIEPGHNAIDLTLDGQSFIEILRDGRPIMRTGTTDRTFTLSAGPGKYTIHSDGKVTAGPSRDATPHPAPGVPHATGGMPRLVSDLASGALGASLQLSSDAQNRHEVDGIPKLPADGISYITITASWIGANAPESLYIRATGGKVRPAIVIEEQIIRSAELHGGVARFRLVSEAQPRVVTVWVLGGNPPLRASLEVEFTPT